MSKFEVGDKCVVRLPITTQLSTTIYPGTKCEVIEVWPSGVQLTIRTENGETIYNVDIASVALDEE